MGYLSGRGIELSGINVGSGEMGGGGSWDTRKAWGLSCRVKVGDRGSWILRRLWD